MVIVVCMKQVPEKCLFDHEKGRIYRGIEHLPEGMDPNDPSSHIKQLLDPFSEMALEQAAGLKDEYPDIKIIALMAGPPSAVSSLGDALAIAADEAYLVTDPSFAGSDVSVTAKILTSAIKHIEALNKEKAIVFTGERSADAGTGALAPYLSGLLDRPLVSGCSRISLSDDDICAVKKRETDSVVIETEQSSVISFGSCERPVRLPTMSRIFSVSPSDVKVITMDELETDFVADGFANKTVVQFSKDGPGRRKVVFSEGKDDSEKAKSLLNKLLKNAILNIQ